MCKIVITKLHSPNGFLFLIPSKLHTKHFSIIQQYYTISQILYLSFWLNWTTLYFVHVKTCLNIVIGHLSISFWATPFIQYNSKSKVKSSISSMFWSDDSIIRLLPYVIRLLPYVIRLLHWECSSYTILLLGSYFMLVRQVVSLSVHNFICQSHIKLLGSYSRTLIPWESFSKTILLLRSYFSLFR